MVNPAPFTPYVGWDDATPAPLVPSPTAAPVVPAACIDPLADWHQRYRELKDAEKKIVEMIDEARTVLMDSVKRVFVDGLPQDLDLTIGGRPVMHIKQVTQKRVDTKRLRREQPALAEQYSVESTQERLTIL